jgi:hypothetical protein
LHACRCLSSLRVLSRLHPRIALEVAGAPQNPVDTMQFPGHAGKMGKSMWDSYLVDEAWNCDFHFDMDGVETLHFWWQATTSGKPEIRAAMA